MGMPLTPLGIGGHDCSQLSLGGGRNHTGKLPASGRGQHIFTKIYKNLFIYCHTYDSVDSSSSSGISSSSSSSSSISSSSSSSSSNSSIVI